MQSLLRCVGWLLFRVLLAHTVWRSLLVFLTLPADMLFDEAEGVAVGVGALRRA